MWNAVMLGESGMHLNRPYEGILCNNDVWRYGEVFARLLKYIIDDCSSCIAPPLWYVLREKWRVTLYSHTHTHQLILAILVVENWLSSAKTLGSHQLFVNNPADHLPLFKPTFCCARQKWSSGQAYRDRVKSCLFLNKVGLEVLCWTNRPRWHGLLQKLCYREIREIGWW